MFTKIYNLFRQPAATNQVTHEGYIPYFGGADNFPLKWAKAISDSPSATSCLSTLSDFMEGYGFSDGDLEKLIVDSKGGTLFELHQKTVKEFAQNEGFFWLLKYDATARVTHWEVLPFENCRLGKPDDNGFISKIYYNPFFGTGEYIGRDKKRTKIYDVFNPAAVREQYKVEGDTYKGQVLFVGTTNAMSRFYPIHEAYSAVKWMKIESGVSDYHEDNINNGFHQKFILLMRGNPSAPSTNPDYQNDKNPITVAAEFERVVSENFMGASKGSNMMTYWLDNPDEKPEMLQVPSSANGDLFVTLDNQSTKKITIAWKVPAILANIHEGVSLGGDANQIRVAVKLMQQRVIKKQRILTDSYSKILKLLQKPYTEDVDIVPYNPYPELEVLDDKIWNALTPEEQRKWVQDNTEIDLTETEAIQPKPQPPTQTNSFRNAVPIGFPDNVKSKVKKTLDYIDKMGLKCGGKSGRQVSEAILTNTNMGYKQLKRIYSYLKAREEYSNALNNEGCHVIEYNAWGGKEMFDFLDVKLKDIDSWLN